MKFTISKICNLQKIFGEKLVKDFMFDTDYEPKLPSPSQLKYKILIKNKKIPPTDIEVAKTKSNNSVTKSSQAWSSVVYSHGYIGPHRSSSTSAGTTTNDDMIIIVEEEDDYYNDDDFEDYEYEAEFVFRSNITR